MSGIKRIIPHPLSAKRIGAQSPFARPSISGQTIASSARLNLRTPTASFPPHLIPKSDVQHAAAVSLCGSSSRANSRAKSAGLRLSGDDTHDHGGARILGRRPKLTEDDLITLTESLDEPSARIQDFMERDADVEGDETSMEGLLAILQDTHSLLATMQAMQPALSDSVLSVGMSGKMANALVSVSQAMQWLSFTECTTAEECEAVLPELKQALELLQNISDGPADALGLYDSAVIWQNILIPTFATSAGIAISPAMVSDDVKVAVGSFLIRGHELSTMVSVLMLEPSEDFVSTAASTFVAYAQAYLEVLSYRDLIAQNFPTVVDAIDNFFKASLARSLRALLTLIDAETESPHASILKLDSALASLSLPGDDFDPESHSTIAGMLRLRYTRPGLARLGIDKLPDGVAADVWYAYVALTTELAKAGQMIGQADEDVEVDAVSFIQSAKSLAQSFNDYIDLAQTNATQLPIGEVELFGFAIEQVLQDFTVYIDTILEILSSDEMKKSPDRARQALLLDLVAQIRALSNRLSGDDLFATWAREKVLEISAILNPRVSREIPEG